MKEIEKPREKEYSNDTDTCIFNNGYNKGRADMEAYYKSIMSKLLAEKDLLKIVDKVEEDYGVEQYVCREDNIHYIPTGHERMLIRDFHEGFKQEFIEAIVNRIKEITDEKS